MPERSVKRVKPNPEPKESVNTASTAQIRPPHDNSPAVKVSAHTSELSPEQEQQSTWYSRTWSRKATPVTHVARESISSASNAATQAVSAVATTITPKPKSVRTPSLQAALGKTTSNRSTPAEVETTKIHATPNTTSVTELSRGESGHKDEKDMAQPAADRGQSLTTAQVEDRADPNRERTMLDSAEDSTKAEQSQKSTKDTIKASSAWLPWLAKAEEGLEGDQKPSKSQRKTSLTVLEDATATTASNSPLSVIAASADRDQDTVQPASKRGWLQIWGNERNIRPSSAPPRNRTAMNIEDVGKPSVTQSLRGSETGLPLSTSHSKASSIVASEPPPTSGNGTRLSGWVFWSRDGNNSSNTSQKEEPHQGEIAISDTPSQGKPRRASIALSSGKDKPGIEPELKANPQGGTESSTSSTQNIKWPREVADLVPKVLAPGASEDATKVETSKATAIGKAPEKAAQARTQPSATPKKTRTHLLPSLRETLKVQQNMSLLQQLRRLLYNTKSSELQHLSLVPEPPRVRNALAIGVHGYFPAPLIRSVLGQPTGTSIKFADMAARSIQNWTKARGYECQVKTAALEGEGRIAERTELLWKLLLNWIDEIRKADFVLVACHSQGVPVAVMLVAKLIEFGCVNKARIGICAMAGVNLGPFPEFKSRWISGSAGELFEFSDPSSKVSEGYLAALENVLNFGVRVSFIGSIDDQLVSLESSLFTPISHPYVFRAVSIDSRVHTPSFLSHLMGFTLKLLNYGVPDHGLIRELSSPLAGSLYTGEGHSRIYEDEEVYDLAVAFALETNDMLGASMTQRPSVVGVSNPYILPFAMRGVLEEDFVKSELQSEALELLQEFDDWKPTTKALKDVKFRLEGIRSKR